MLLDEPVFYGTEIFVEQLGIRLDLVKSIEQSGDAGILVQTLRPGPRKQAGQKFRAIGRQLDQRFVHQVFEHVLAANVDDERDLRLKRYDIREVLFRSDADVSAAGLAVFGQLREHMLGRQFVRDKVV